MVRLGERQERLRTQAFLRAIALRLAAHDAWEAFRESNTASRFIRWMRLEALWQRAQARLDRRLLGRPGRHQGGGRAFAARALADAHRYRFAEEG